MNGNNDSPVSDSPALFLPAKRDDADRLVVTKSKYNVAVIAGYLLIGFAAALAFGVYKYMEHGHEIAGMSIQEVFIVGICLTGALVCAIFGTKAMISSSAAPQVVIPNEDRKLLEDLIREGNEKGIDQYVRLSSLSGTTGSFTKLGLSGLPLATIGLTLFFSLVSIFHETGFLDLAKLTLGAFIGSFVQRSVTGEKVNNDNNKTSHGKSPL
jgi:hypothetical protein